MKNKLFTLYFFALSLGSALAQTEAAAIQQAIESESKAYHTNPDRAVFISYWHITADTRMVYTGPDGSQFLTGEQMKAALAAGQLPPLDNAATQYSNYVVRASGTVGWATFDQISTAKDGTASYMHEFRCMEKVDGAWKTVSASVHQYKP